MSDDYTFRDKPISGLHAMRLLDAIRLVQEEAPNYCPEEIESLQEIRDDFMKKFAQDLKAAFAHKDEHEDEWDQ